MDPFGPFRATSNPVFKVAALVSKTAGASGFSVTVHSDCPAIRKSFRKETMGNTSMTDILGSAVGLRNRVKGNGTTTARNGLGSW